MDQLFDSFRVNVLAAMFDSEARSSYMKGWRPKLAANAS